MPEPRLMRTAIPYFDHQCPLYSGDLTFLIGPPKSGKTAFLTMLGSKLSEEECTVFYLMEDPIPTGFRGVLMGKHVLTQPIPERLEFAYTLLTEAATHRQFIFIDTFNTWVHKATEAPRPYDAHLREPHHLGALMTEHAERLSKIAIETGVHIVASVQVYHPPMEKDPLAYNHPLYKLASNVLRLLPPKERVRQLPEIVKSRYGMRTMDLKT